MAVLDVVGDLISRLSQVVDVPVSVWRIDDTPKKAVTLWREGGRRDNALIDSPGIGIYCWAPSELEAWQLADQIADAMASLKFADGYADVYMESMRSDPDPDSRSPRYYLSYTIKSYLPNKEA